MLAHALAYAARGWRVLPIEPRGKRPLTAHGVNDATTDAETIRAWWARWPDANIGITCGEAFVVLDVDPRNGGHRSLSALVLRYGRLPLTLAANTGGGGLHALWRRSASEATWRGSIAPGLDIKASGYIVAAPSVHASGARYAWRDPNVTIADAPAWLVALATVMPAPLRPHRVVAAGGAYHRAALKRACATVCAAPKGARYNTLRSAAWSLARLVGAGLDAHDVRHALATAGESCGLSRAEIGRAIDSALHKRSGLQAGCRRPEPFTTFPRLKGVR